MTKNDLLYIIKIRDNFSPQFFTFQSFCKKHLKILKFTKHTVHGGAVYGHNRQTNFITAFSERADAGKGNRQPGIPHQPGRIGANPPHGGGGSHRRLHLGSLPRQQQTAGKCPHQPFHAAGGKGLLSAAAPAASGGVPVLSRHRHPQLHRAGFLPGHGRAGTGCKCCEEQTCGLLQCGR